MSLASLIPWPYRLLALLVLCLALFGCGYLRGRLAEQAYAADERALQLQHVLRRERAQAQISNRVATAHEAGRAADRVIHQTIEKAVIRYVAIHEHPVYHLDAGWLCRHDAAALHVLPDAACESAASARTPTAYTSDDALAANVANYAACHDNARQLKDLQDWVRKQADLAANPEEPKHE